jgi:hypothetical protein
MENHKVNHMENENENEIDNRNKEKGGVGEKET